jgi:hypothetical protein
MEVGVMVDSSWFPGLNKLTGGKPKKMEVELFESSATFFNQGWFAPDLPLCRPGG